MVSFNSWLDSLVAVGYNEPKARSRIAHDVVLMAMEKSGLARNVTKMFMICAICARLSISSVLCLFCMFSSLTIQR